MNAISDARKRVIASHEKAIQEGNRWLITGWAGQYKITTGKPHYFKTTAEVLERLEKWRAYMKKLIHIDLETIGNSLNKLEAGAGGILQLKHPAIDYPFIMYWMMPIEWQLSTQFTVGVRGNVHITKTSLLTNAINEMELEAPPQLVHEGYCRYKQGELIQVAMPFLTDVEREFMMTGITANEW